MLNIRSDLCLVWHVVGILLPMASGRHVAEMYDAKITEVMEVLLYYVNAVLNRRSA